MSGSPNPKSCPGGRIDTIRLANEMSHTLFMSAIPTFISIFTELIPGLFSQPNIGSFLLELFSIILAIPLSIFSILLHGGLTILGLAPFLIQIVIDIVVYKWTAPIHILADIGGGIILVLALALIVLGAGFVGAFMLFTVFFPFFGPIFSRASGSGILPAAAVPSSANKEAILWIS